MSTPFKNLIKKFFSRTETTETPSVFSSYKTYMAISNKTPVCMAPWTSMSFNIDGTVTACCLNRKTSVSIKGKTIREVWESEAFETLRNQVKKEDLSYDCAECLNNLNNSAFDTIKAKDYIKYKPNNKYPKVMEFCLENTCNLACTMCNSVLSSSIRKEKGLAPSISSYDQGFVEELKEFIPFLEEAIFAGGEPFLIQSYFDIWELMLEINPQIKISIVTNGTVLNSKIKDLLKRGNFNFNISIDSLDKETYEGIRRNANFDKLMQNLDWFIDYAFKNKTEINIPICPLVSNWKTIPDAIRFVNEKKIRANFVFVERPFSLSLIYAPSKLLEEIESFYKEQDFENLNEISNHNISKFEDLIKNLSSWKKKNLSIKPTNENYLVNLEKWESSFKDANETSKKIVSLIKEIVPELESNNKDMVVGLLAQLSSERLHELFKNKNKREIKIIFEELIG